MTKAIFLTSTKKSSGKSAIAIGAFLKFKEEGYKVGYFKPIGDSLSITPKIKTDKDASVFTIILGRRFSKEQICPQFFNPAYFLDEILPEENEITPILEKIKDSYQLIASKSDIVIIEGNHSYSQYLSINLSDLRMAKELNAEMIICAPISNDDDLNLIISAFKYIKSKGIPIAGVILSGTSESATNRIEKYHKPILKNLGITVIGGLKHSKQLEKPTIAEILEAINGQLISGDFIKIKNQLIDGFLIGAMGASSGISFIKKKIDQCVITGGDRSDMALAAIETNAKLIIFTGNLHPIPKVINAAENNGVPLIITSADTFTVIDLLNKIHKHIQPNEIQLCRDQVEENIDWDKFPK